MFRCMNKHRNRYSAFNKLNRQRSRRLGHCLLRKVPHVSKVRALVHAHVQPGHMRSMHSMESRLRRHLTCREAPRSEKHRQRNKLRLCRLYLRQIPRCYRIYPKRSRIEQSLLRLKRHCTPQVRGGLRNDLVKSQMRSSPFESQESRTRSQRTGNVGRSPSIPDFWRLCDYIIEIGRRLRLMWGPKPCFKYALMHKSTSGRWPSTTQESTFRRQDPSVVLLSRTHEAEMSCKNILPRHLTILRRQQTRTRQHKEAGAVIMVEPATTETLVPMGWILVLGVATLQSRLVRMARPHVSKVWTDVQTICQVSGNRGILRRPRNSNNHQLQVLSRLNKPCRIGRLFAAFRYRAFP